MPAKTRRLDKLLVDRSLATSRQRAQAMISAGLVWVNQMPRTKPGSLVAADAAIEVRGAPDRFVSRGGHKLDAALQAFHISVDDCRCMDIGASTGGFTDCLLQAGAAHVIAVDVGYGQLAWSLRQDPRVEVLERTNIRHLDPSRVQPPVDLITIDTAFISLSIVVPAALRFLAPGGTIIALIKPQFEVGKGQVGKGGVVRDPVLHRQVIDDLSKAFTDMGMTVSGVIPSPIIGPKGNREFLACLQR